MTQDHPITPPPELVKQWIQAWYDAEVKDVGVVPHVATQAARWGADQELEACDKWLSARTGFMDAHDLRAARRPKPPSLKEQALEALDSASYQPGSYFKQIDPARSLTIRRALEALPDD